MTTDNEIKSNIIKKLINYGLVEDNMFLYYTDINRTNKDQLKHNKDFVFYRKNFCENFYTKHPNRDSICCEEDVMLKRNEMTKELNKVKKLFDVFPVDLTNKERKPEWIIYKDCGSRGAEENCMKCVCSHNILVLRFIRHRKTGIVLLLGNECINNFEEDLKGQIKCCMCNTLKNVRNRTKKPYNLKCCSMKCYEERKEEKKYQKNFFRKTLKEELKKYFLQRERYWIERQEIERMRERMRERERQRQGRMRERERQRRIQRQEIDIEENKIHNKLDLTIKLLNEILSIYKKK
jgi:hypothetical protein